MERYKQVMVVRTDIKMSKGKVAAQCSHASVGAVRNSKKEIIEAWLNEGGTKIVLKAKSDKELIILQKKARVNKLATSLIKDAGQTEIPPGTITALGIGPDKIEKIDKVTGKLKTL